MKKIILALGILGLLSSVCFGGAFYKAYEDTVTVETTLSIATDLGAVWAKGGYIVNDETTNVMTVEFSMDGTNYGDDIMVRGGEQLNFDVFVRFKKIKITPQTSVTYRCLSGVCEMSVE